MKHIHYKDLSACGPVEECRELCNALMAYQAEKATVHQEDLAAMCFENRLKPAFDGAKERFLYVALNNLYIKDAYRGLGVGKHLMEKAMAWMQNVPETEYLFVHVSNGNTAGALYEKYGFRYSHKAMDGAISVYWKKKPLSVFENVCREG